MSQKNVFLESEADAWFTRNQDFLLSRNFADDPVVKAVGKLPGSAMVRDDRDTRILEVGCGSGHRLAHLKKHFQAEVSGLEPSRKATGYALELGINAVQGTADALPFSPRSFDIVIFGFCLYLCDRDDLFRIASEADRVLDHDGWLIIHDFFAATPRQREYHHKSGLHSYKMDYRKLFDWHPAYTCYDHCVTGHGHDVLVDDPDEWVATSILRKRTAL